MAASESAPTKCILAVDDEQEILNLYDTFLKLKGYQVRTVTGAKECIESLMDEPPDVILLDINMPGIDGLRLLEMIRSKDNTTPIIMITARGDQATVKEAARLGCDNFILKPFKFEQLAERIEAELFRLDFDDVRDYLAALTAPNVNVFREVGMQDYDKVKWDPYVFRVGSRDVCLMVTRGLKPKTLVKSPVEAILGRAHLLYRHPLRWKKVWPVF